MSRWPGATRLAGVGIGLRPELSRELASTQRALDWLEIIPENYIQHGGWRQRELEQAAARWPLVGHGVCVSVGGPDDLDAAYLARLKQLIARIGAEFYSDHLCWATAAGHHYHDLLPLPFSEEAVRWTARRARQLSETLEVPLLLENITFYAEMPGGDLTEGEFIRAVLEEGDAYLLLDVNNAYQNALNHGRDPLRMLEALPLERTRQMHLAGHEPDEEGVLLDHHGSPVDDAVWALYREAVRRVGNVPTLLEWDNNIPSLDRVLDEADRAREIMKQEEVCVA